jgi:DNA-binding FrmR family transcriptional regulator
MVFGGLDWLAMDLPEETIRDLTKRLRRAEGQVRGVQQMLTDGRDCRDIVTQLSAATKALEQAGFLLVAAGLTWCISHPEDAAAAGYHLDDVQKMFLKLG